MHIIYSFQSGVRLFILTLFFLFLNGCSSDNLPPKLETPEVKVVVLLPLSGAYAHIGDSYLKAIELALFEFADPNLKAQVLDTRGTFEGTLEALKHAQEADIVLGPVISTSLDAAAIWALKRKIPVISLTNNFIKAQPGVFVFGLPPQREVKEMVKFAVKNRMDRFTAILPSGAFGGIMREAIEAEIKNYNMTLTDVFFYSPNMEELPNIINQMQKKTVDGIFIVNGGQELFTISKALQDEKISGRVLGTQQWKEADVNSWSQLSGAWYTTTHTAQKRVFENRYISLYRKHPDTMAYLAYDAMAMLAKVHKLYPDAPFSLEVLTSSKGFVGLQGSFKLNKDGSVQRNITIMEVKEGASNPIGINEGN